MQTSVIVLGMWHKTFFFTAIIHLHFLNFFSYLFIKLWDPKRNKNDPFKCLNKRMRGWFLRILMFFKFTLFCSLYLFLESKFPMLVYCFVKCDASFIMVMIHKSKISNHRPLYLTTIIWIEELKNNIIFKLKSAAMCLFFFVFFIKHINHVAYVFVYLKGSY